MSQFDLFYRAYESYKKEFEKNRDNILFKKANYAPMNKNDYISSIKVECKVEEDWINIIERGVYYIAKAIKEDRQFIRNEGDVLPIEKIRRVSKDSITDLSKHSNYITRKPEEGANIIPEKLLMINRENDYAIYENRVIYTVLLYLKEFVGSRVDTLTKVLNKYEGKCHINKALETGDRKLEFQLDFTDVRANDDIAIKNNKYQELIQRLTGIYNDVIVLLSTNLMMEMAKHPTVSRPIIKTNVLKMNTNFKESLACFDYVCAYEGLGFELNVYEDVITPLTKDQQDSFADIMLLSTFLTYAFNNKLEAQLGKQYEKDNKIRIKEEADEKIKYLDGLMLEYKESNKDIKEYIGALKDGYRILEERIEEFELQIKDMNHQYEQEKEDSEKLRIAEIQRLDIDHQERIEALIQEHEEEIERLNKLHQEEIERLNQAHQEEIESINQAHQEEMYKLQDEYGGRIDEMRNNYETEISTLKESYETQISSLKDGYETKITSLTEGYETELSETKEKYETKIETMTTSYESTIQTLKDDCQTKVTSLEEQNKELTDKYNQTKEDLDYYSRDRKEFMAEIRKNELEPLQKANERLHEEAVVAKAEVFTIRLAGKEIEDQPADYTAEERFNQLDEAKTVLDKFFKEAWKAAKAEIKKKHYTVKKKGGSVDEQ